MRATAAHAPGDAPGVDPSPPAEPGAEARAADPTPAPDPDRARSDPAGILRDVAGTASRVVVQAASILEEEIAAGIVAARQVEERLVRSTAVPAGKANPLVLRLRKDLHEVIDMALDLLDAAADYAGMAKQPDLSIRSVTRQNQSFRLKDGHLPTLVLPAAGRAGGAVEIALGLENNLGEPTGEFGFLATDLVSEAGDRILAARVQVQPPRLDLPAYAPAQVTVGVSVPRGKPPGTYAGLLQTTRPGQFRAVLLLPVEGSG